MKLLLIIAVVLGFWVGMNVYNDQKLFTNPLAEKSAREKLIDAAKTGINESGEYLQEKGGELLQHSKELASDAVNKGRQVVVKAKDAAVQNITKPTSNNTSDNQ